MTARALFVTLLITLSIAGSASAQTGPPSISAMSKATRTAMVTDASRHAKSFFQAPPQRDSRWNGFLIGVVAGAIPGVLVGMGVKTYCENEARNCDSAVPIVGAVGGLVGGFIGAAVDDAIGNSVTSPRRIPPPSVRFSLRF